MAPLLGVAPLPVVLAGGDPPPPAVWYLGHVPERTSPEWDTVPAPGAGNRLAPRQYQAKWMATYQQRLEQADPAIPPPSSTGDGTTPVAGSCIGGAVAPVAGGWSLPGPRALLDAGAERAFAGPTARTQPDDHARSDRRCGPADHLVWNLEVTVSARTAARCSRRKVSDASILASRLCGGGV